MQFKELNRALSVVEVRVPMLYASKCFMSLLATKVVIGRDDGLEGVE